MLTAEIVNKIVKL